MNNFRYLAKTERLSEYELVITKPEYSTFRESAEMDQAIQTRKPTVMVIVFTINLKVLLNSRA